MSDVIFRSVKESVKRALPRQEIERAKRLIWARQIREARHALNSVPPGRPWLTEREMDELCRAYPVKREWTQTEGKPDFERARSALRALGSRNGPQAILDVGGGPGYVAWAAALMGHNIWCADILDELTPAAQSAGVTSLIADACALPSRDNSFDGLWSYNSFEHFHDPERALSEFYRVVRPNGRIHLAFAPLYNAPLGLHAFFEIGVPFCQHLWPDDMILPRVTSKDLWCLNRWSLSQYRNLWKKFDGRFLVERYSEESDFQGLELIRRYPECFVKVSRNLEDFVTSKIIVTFKVIKSPS